MKKDRQQGTTKEKAVAVQRDVAAPVSKSEQAIRPTDKMSPKLRETAERSWQRHEGSYRYLRDR